VDDTRERRTLGAVLAAVVGAVACATAWWWWHERGTPALSEVAVVYRAAGEAVASDRPRRLPAGARVEAAAVVTFTRRGGAARRVCALAPVEVGGERLEAEPPAAWPAGYGALRATWFTVEPAVFAWERVDAAVADRLRYADLLAPELGQALLARPELEAHNDDFLSSPIPGNTVPAGPLRLKVRVGLYRDADRVLPDQAVSSPGAAELLAGTPLGVVIALPEAAGIDPAVADLARAACVTFAAGTWPDGGAAWPLALSPRELVRRRLVATPEAVAAAAAVGDPLAAPWRGAVGLTVAGEELRGAAHVRRARWGSEVRPGDAVTAGGRWAVLVADDGDGALTLGDRALFAWLGPVRFAPLAEALGGPAPGVPLALRRR